MKRYLDFQDSSLPVILSMTEAQSLKEAFFKYRWRPRQEIGREDLEDPNITLHLSTRRSEIPMPVREDFNPEQVKIDDTTIRWCKKEQNVINILNNQNFKARVEELDSIN